MAGQAEDGGPPNPNNWNQAFEDRFDSGTLDESAWSVGWGWGNTTSTTRTEISPDNVTLEDSTLRLKGTNDGNNVLSGAVNTKGNVEFGPGSYVEARLKFPNRTGFHPAFWAKSTSGAWPPELDVVELAMDGSGNDDTHKSRHFLHWSASTQPDDTSTHEKDSFFHEPGDDLTENYHVYAAEWQSDSITYYVDGQEVKSWTNPTILESFRKGAPFFLTLNTNIVVENANKLSDYLGTADLSTQWGETFDADWVRVWNQ